MDEGGGGSQSVQSLENGWPFGKKEQDAHYFRNSDFFQDVDSDGISPMVSDLLMPSLELSDKIDVSLKRYKDAGNPNCHKN